MDWYRAAAELRQRNGLRDVVSDTDLRRMLQAAGMQLSGAPLAGVNELIRGSTLTINRDLAYDERRWLIGHALGHIYLHAVEQIASDGRGLDDLERDAELFAGSLFLEPTWHDTNEWELAELHALPEWRIRRWVALCEEGAVDELDGLPQALALH